MSDAPRIDEGGHEDLATVLRRPPGYTAVDGDLVSGPIKTREQVRRIFVDHAEDAAEISYGGFRQGYQQTWDRVTPPPRLGDLPAHTTAVATVVQFDSAEHAAAIAGYLRGRYAADGWHRMPVPASLADGYGGSAAVDPTAVDYNSGVLWTRGPLLLMLTLTSLTPPRSGREVVDMALAQNDAL